MIKDYIQIAPPTLIIWGTDDGALDTCLAQMSAKFCKNAVVRHVDGASHWVQQVIAYYKNIINTILHVRAG
jgi:pimeloyl-ACP methyl ester carboxylesterase